jgi:hypothetical protein
MSCWKVDYLPVGLEMMLRAYFVQQWFNLSDPGLEDALYDSPAVRRLPTTCYTAKSARSGGDAGSSNAPKPGSASSAGCWSATSTSSPLPPLLLPGLPLDHTQTVNRREAGHEAVGTGLGTRESSFDGPLLGRGLKGRFIYRNMRCLTQQDRNDLHLFLLQRVS